MNSFQRLRAFERRQRRRKIISKIPVPRLKDFENPFEKYDAGEFKKRFHMFKETAYYVITLIEKDLVSPVKRGTRIPINIQVCAVLRFYATGSFQITLSDFVKCCQSTISEMIKRVSIAIANMCKRFITYPSHQQASSVREGFYGIGSFPGVVGCIDCTHIEIESPGGNDAELFRNRKGRFSINVQGICDHDMNFINLVASWYGSAHDSRIFQNSVISMDLEAGNVPGILLGDAGYPCLPYLMTPLSHPTTQAEIRYNKSQIRTRNIVERVFGVWKRRFPCLLYVREKLSTTFAIIVATAVLHNITRKRRDLIEGDDPIHKSKCQGVSNE